ncbi:MAG TPA: hypothetical protein VG758_10495 [Hyphomicrobiaceae bacterium]|nr:hypothetical protein [Hyphomicrobiaceae bacterium]
MSAPIDRPAIACVPRRVAVAILALALLATVAGSGGLIAPAAAQAAALTREQAAYDKALREFKAVLAERRGQIEAKKPLPERPGQALYLARLQVISTYKDLTDAVPARIGRSNRFGVPPAYFDADIEPLVEEYAALFAIMQAPPAGAQASATPFKDVADLGRAIARARGLDDATVEAAGRISLGIFFAETGGNQNIGNARSNTYKGSFQTGVAEDRKGRAAWAALRPRITALNPRLAARDQTETARVGTGDQRFNHWTAVRNGLMNAHYDLFAQIPEIASLLPDKIDQMKLFQLIQIVPTPTRAALKSGNFASYRISDPRIMGYLRNNSIFTFGKADRARASATMREILDAMWLFTPKFERARTLYEEIKTQERRGAG